MGQIKQIKVSTRMDAKSRVEAKVREHSLVIDQPAAGGGENGGPTPLETLLFALAGCISHISKIVAVQRKIILRGVNVDVEGELDLNYLMGKTTEGRAGFSSFRAYVELDADLSVAEKQDFLKEVDRRCPVSDNLLHGGQVVVELRQP